VGPLVLYTKEDSDIDLPETNNETDFFKQLETYRFGVVDGYTNIPAFDDNKHLIKKVVNTDKENLEQLYKGNVDFILIDKLNAQYILMHELPK
jgi:ABC-type amino acid transport substrate-binding protein